VFSRLCDVIAKSGSGGGGGGGGGEQQTRWQTRMSGLQGKQI